MKNTNTLFLKALANLFIASNYERKFLDLEYGPITQMFSNLAIYFNRITDFEYELIYDESSLSQTDEIFYEVLELAYDILEQIIEETEYEDEIIIAAHYLGFISTYLIEE